MTPTGIEPEALMFAAQCLIQLHHRVAQLTITLYKNRPGYLSTANCYGLKVSGIETQWGQDFPHPFIPAPGAHPASSTMGTASPFRG